MNRRGFLGAGAALVAAACVRGQPPTPAGELIATNHGLGHRLREGGLPKAGETRRARVVIVGAGISGLSAAWRLRRAGFDEFELLELEDRAGDWINMALHHRSRSSSPPRIPAAPATLASRRRCAWSALNNAASSSVTRP